MIASLPSSAGLIGGNHDINRRDQMLCEECIHAVSIYPGCIDCNIGYDPFWNEEAECEDCDGYKSAPLDEKENDFAVCEAVARWKGEI